MTKMVKALLNGEYEIILPEHRAVRPEWHQPGGWEKARLASMKKTTKKGDVVYYVGSEEGEMCALLQMWGAKLIMFEPNALVWPNVKAIWDANKLEMPEGAFAAFAGNEDTHPELMNGAKTWPESVAGPVISNHGFKNLCEADGTIPIVKIDTMVANGYPVPDMITMDTEGADWEVLKGAEETMKKHHPKLYVSVHPEFMYEIYKVYSHDFREWIKALGYKETLLAYDHEVHMFYEASE